MKYYDISIYPPFSFLFLSFPFFPCLSFLIMAENSFVEESIIHLLSPTNEAQYDEEGQIESFNALFQSYHALKHINAWEDDYVWFYRELVELKAVCKVIFERIITFPRDYMHYALTLMRKEIIYGLLTSYRNRCRSDMRNELITEPKYQQIIGYINDFQAYWLTCEMKAYRIS